MIRLGGLIFVVAIAFWLWAIFDSLTADDTRIRVLPKAIWVILILLLFEFGALAWVLFGRPRGGVQPRLAGPSGSRSRPRSQGPVGPDDDPEFLRKL